MKDSDFLDLANRVIDGVGTEYDRAALEAVLHDSTQRRLDYEQLVALSSILNAVRPVDPPADLRERILASLPLNVEKEPVSWVSRVRESIIDSIRARPRTSLAYAVVSGLLVGVVAFGALSGTVRTDDSNMFGTMSDYRSEDGFLRIDEARTVDEGLDASMVLVASQDAFRVEIDLASDGPVDVALSIEPAAIMWAGVLRADASSDLRAVVGENTVTLSSVETGTYAFIGSMDERLSDDARIDVTFRSGDIELGRALLEFVP
jgi:hypothetical protein